MTVLSKEERETIITFDEAGKDAIIFTYSQAWQTHLEKKLGLKPTASNGFGGKEYVIDKKRLSKPRMPRYLSAEARQKLSERMSKTRLESSACK